MIEVWFAERPATRARVLAEAAKIGAGRALLGALQREHGFPFSSVSALRKWVRAQGAAPAQTATARPGPPPPQVFLRSERDVKALDRTEDLFVTCAVNNSPVVAPALRALERAAEECAGKVLCLPVRYKNPTRRGDVEPGEWWAPEVGPYLVDNEVRPHPLLSIMTTRVQATAPNPLPARVNGRTKARSALFGHPQLAMRTVATPQQKLPKILYTTGAITAPVYSDTLSGDMARFHHGVGAVRVSVRGERFHLRELTWDGDRFIDLDREYREAGVFDAPRPDILGVADVHVNLERLDRPSHDVFERILSELRPRRLAIHDWHDGRKVNPHESANALLRAARAGYKVEDELRELVTWFERYVAQADLDEIVVPRSNHDVFLDRWVQSGRFAAEDAELFHYLSWRMIRQKRETGRFPMALELALRDYLRADLPVRFLNADEPYLLHDVDWGAHGHLGPNGARGAPGNMAQMGVKFVCFHVHGPVIWQGGYWGGVFQLQGHDYAQGPSNWLVTHVLGHANGKRQMIHCIDGHYR